MSLAHLISAFSDVIGTGRAPASTSARRSRFVNVWAVPIQTRFFQKIKSGSTPEWFTHPHLATRHRVQSATSHITQQPALKTRPSGQPSGHGGSRACPRTSGGRGRVHAMQKDDVFIDREQAATMRQQQYSGLGEQRARSGASSPAGNRLPALPGSGHATSGDVLRMQGLAGNQATSQALRSVVQRMPKAPSETENKVKGKRAGTDLKGQLIKELKKLGWQTYGASPSLTLHFPMKSSEGPTDIKGVKGKLYNKTENVRSPRSYKDDRHRQAMRWLCNLIMNKLNMENARPEEVQATIIGDKLHISSNNNASNANLRKLIGRCSTGKDLASELIKAKELRDRLERHRAKLEKRVAATTPDLRYMKIVDIKIDESAVPADVPSNGLHAERRLAALKDFDASETVGVKRPCTVCYNNVYANLHTETVEKGHFKIYPGPLWVSSAANTDMKEYNDPQAIESYADELSKTIIAAGGTYISLSQTGEYTWGYNTDSDSPATESSDDERIPV
jgi:hypothetical protein